MSSSSQKRALLNSLISLRRRNHILPLTNGCTRRHRKEIQNGSNLTAALTLKPKPKPKPKPSFGQCRSMVPRASITANVVPISRSPLLVMKNLFCANGSSNVVRGHDDVSAARKSHEFDECSSPKKTTTTTSSINKINKINTTFDDEIESRAHSRLVVVLDMDECLIHSQFLTVASDCDNYRQYEADRPQSHSYKHDEEPQSIIPSSCESFRLSLPDGDQVHVNKRPNLDDFLRNVTSRYETYIFTAAMEVYASPVLDKLDPDGSMFSGRFYREHCTFDPSLGVYIKDLNNIKLNNSRYKENFENDSIDVPFNEKKVVLVDNNPYSFMANPKNGILVSNFYDDPRDDTLHAVIELLDELDSVEDVRPILDEKFGLKQALKEISRNPGYWK